MKKLIIALIVLILLPFQVGAVNKKATLINNNGNKIVVNIGDKIPAGYKLFTEQRLGIALPQNIWVKKNMVGTSASSYNFASGLISTSTISGDYGFDTLSLNIKLVNASTTGANSISFTPAYSNDDGCASSTNSSINWFTSTSTSGILTNLFAVNTTTLYKYNLTGLATQCVRLVTVATHASSTIWVEGLLK